MLADLDLLLTSVFCTADDLLPKKPGNARRSLTDAEVVALCVAQAIMGINSDARFARVAPKRLGHLFPALTKRSGFHKRRDRLAETIEAMISAFASQSPGWHDDLLLVDSTPVECARSRETVKRAGANSLGGATADAADYGYCASHSRYFWGFRLHTLMAPDGTLRAMALTSPKEGEREVCLRLLARVNRSGPLTVLGDKGYAGADFEAMPPPSVRPWCARVARMSPKADSTLPHCASGSSRSTGPPRTSSVSTPTAHAPFVACMLASPAASWRWLRRSHSTISSGAHRGRWSTTWPEPWNYSSSRPAGAASAGGRRASRRRRRARRCWRGSPRTPIRRDVRGIGRSSRAASPPSGSRRSSTIEKLSQPGEASIAAIVASRSSARPGTITIASSRRWRR